MSEQQGRRERAEHTLAQTQDPGAADAFATLTPDAQKALLHKLQVHQVELTQQNEELRRANAEIERLHARYFDLYDLAPVGYCAVHETGLILEANLTLANLLGMARGAMATQPLTRFIHPQDQDIFYHLRGRLLAGTVEDSHTGESTGCELRMRKVDGTFFWALVAATVGHQQPITHGGPDADSARVFRLTLVDITARTQREAAHAASDERWRFAIEGAGDGLWDWNIQAGTAFYSRRYKEMLGYADSEIGNSANEWIQRLHPDDAPGVMAALQPYLDGQAGSATVEYRMLCKDGGWQWTLGRGMVVERDAEGKPLRMIGTNADITERKQSEAVDRFLSQAGNTPGAEPFFAALARFLAQSLQMDYICIDRLDGNQLNATTLAVWHDGQFENNLTYALRDTPCAEVVGQRVCCYPARVCQFFPNDAALSELRAESYIGVTLWGHTGQPIGLIAVIGRRPLTNRAHAETTLARVAVRAAGELERLDAEAALRGSEAHLRAIIQAEPECIKIVDARGRLTQMNPAGLAMVEADAPEQVMGQAVENLLAPEYRQAFAAMHRRVLAGESLQLEFEIIGLKGGRRWLETHAAPLQDHGQTVQLAVTRDITARKQAETKLLLAASVFGHAREGITITDAHGNILDVNEAFTRITGYRREDVLGRNPRFLSSGRQAPEFYAAMWRGLLEQGHWSGEIWNRRKDGGVFAELLTISAVRDAQGATQHYVALFSDITAIKEHQSQLERIAHFDALTNLPNRVLLADRLHQGVAHVARRGGILAVAYLDLDGFKSINDRHGHDVGDQLLIALASRMKQALREGDTLARIGGDEFVAVLTDLDDTQACLSMLSRLLHAAAQPLPVGNLSVQVSASLGVTFYPQARAIEADQLLRQADQAMYQAKLAGKNRCHIFDADQDSSMRVHHESLERIRLALERREFVLYYQPKVNMHSGQVIGAEALIRWQHPEKGLLSPAAFLPVIEEHALAIAIGEWVVDTALCQIEVWRTAGLDIAVSVNVGARQLQQNNFVERLQSTLSAHPRVHPSRLELEILETSALKDIAQVSQVIEACAHIGVRFALDDFGTGYSSLTYLKRLHVTLLKIDQSSLLSGEGIEISARSQ
jgi:diguanylate cyclase (GGDEF)-like protein/PAS domain S-box-containing protein